MEPVDGAGPAEAFAHLVQRLPDMLAWMGLDLALALVPFGLAVLLFRPGRRASPVFWIGFAGFVAFLPNAAYVWAEYLWFFGQLHTAWWLDRWRIPVLLVPYAAFFAIGSLLYVECLHRTRAFFLRRWSPVRVNGLLVALAGCTGIGLYLGRADFNSWTLVLDPLGVLRAIGRLPADPAALARTLLAAGAALTLFATSEVVRAHLRPRALDTGGSAGVGRPDLARVPDRVDP